MLSFIISNIVFLAFIGFFQFEMRAIVPVGILNKKYFEGMNN